MLVNNSIFNFYRGNSFAIEFRVRGWVGGGGGPSNFNVNQSPNLWTQEFEYLDLDFGLDNKYINNTTVHVIMFTQY